MSLGRVLLKLSGEVLGGPDGAPADADALERVVSVLRQVQERGVSLAIVTGGGNIWRFRDNQSLRIPRDASDALGMMASIMNARLLAEALQASGVQATALAAHGNFYFAQPYSPARGRQLLDDGHIVVCGGGTGNPYFTTDSTAALRALELNCEVLLKGTKVDGVYDKDPVQHADAEFFEQLSYDEVLERELGVMDLTAITLCKENSLPVRVFNMQNGDNLLQLVSGETVGTLIQ